MHHTNSKQKETGVNALISEKIHFNARNKEGYTE